MDVIDSLTSQYPELQSKLDDHRHDNLGETLPTVFMGEVARWAESLDAADRRRTEFFELIDDLHRDGDAQTQGLLELGFVESLGRGSSVLADLGPSLGSSEIARAMSR